MSESKTNHQEGQSHDKCPRCNSVETYITQSFHLACLKCKMILKKNVGDGE